MPSSSKYPRMIKMKSSSSNPSDQIKDIELENQVTEENHLEALSILHKGSHHGISRHFEPIHWMDLLVILVAVALSTITGIVVPKYGLKDLTLFYSRTVVALIATLIGLLCSYALYRIGRRFFDNCIWTLLLEAASQAGNGPAHTLSLAIVDDWLSDVGPISGLQVLCYRLFGRPGFRTSFNKKWGLVALFFPFAIYLGALQAFIYGRTVTLIPYVEQQNSTYESIKVFGTMTSEDVARAELVWQSVQDQRREWTYQSLADPLVPKSLKLRDPDNGQIVYVTDAYPSLMDRTGAGYGAFNLSKLSASAAFKFKNLVESEVWSRSSSSRTQENLPSVIYWTRFGQRVRCRMLSSLLQTNLVERSQNNQTFVFIPQDFIQEVFDDIEETLPLEFSNGNYGFDIGLDSIGDSLPNLDQSSISLTAAFAYDGVALSSSSVYVKPDLYTNKLMTVDTMLVRLNKTFTPNGTFPRTGSDGIGYDGAMCVSVISPYLISTYNSTSGLQTLSIISSGTTLPTFGTRVGESVSQSVKMVTISDLVVTHLAAGTNSRLELRKANSRDAEFMPNPTLISLTTGRVNPSLTPGDRYATLDRIKLQDTIGLIDSRFSLPYFVGTGEIEAYKFEGVEKAYAHVLIGWFLGSMGLVLITGLVGCFLRPVLPLNLPHRETSLSAFHPLLQKVPPQEGDSADLAAALASVVETEVRDDEILQKFQELRRRASAR